MNAAAQIETYHFLLSTSMSHINTPTEQNESAATQSEIKMLDFMLLAEGERLSVTSLRP